MNADEVRRFHDVFGHAYLAYAYPEHAAVYPTGARRTAVVASLVRQRLATCDHRPRIVDLGCGRGDLCFELAAAGCEVIGVDFAISMIAEAEAQRARMAPEWRERATFLHRDCFANELAPGAYDAVTALGVLETEAEDAPLFREAHRLLRGGGTFAITARNRLFNLVSLNAHTRREIASGDALDLLAEIEGLLERTAADEFRAALESFTAALREMPSDVSAAVRETEGAPPAPVRLPATRQHTPLTVENTAAAHGFESAVHAGIHPHVMPPRLELLAPELYNTLGKAAEALARLPIGLVWSSAFATSVVKR